jgi:hypothetical protein
MEGFFDSLDERSETVILYFDSIDWASTITDTAKLAFLFINADLICLSPYLDGFIWAERGTDKASTTIVIVYLDTDNG